MDLSCLIVHHNVPELLAECLASLRSELASLEARGLSVELRVIDNASTSETRRKMDDLGLAAEELLALPENVGYAAAANAGYARSRAPLVLVSNPDVTYLPGSLSRMVEAIEASRAAVVGPRTWWDRATTLQLYPSLPETRRSIETEIAVAQRAAWPRHSLDWQLRMLDLWTATERREQPSLSGACLLARRAAVDRAGGLFDPSFFLYYDDSDLSERVRKRGDRLIFEPRAEIVHLYNQTRLENVPELMASSRRRFLAKHYGQGEAVRLIRAHRKACPSEADFDAWSLRALGPLEAPPAFCWSAEERAVFAIGLNPQVMPAAGALVERGYTVSDDLWGQMTPGRYYARAVGVDSGRVLSYWSFERR